MELFDTFLNVYGNTIEKCRKKEIIKQEKITRKMFIELFTSIIIIFIVLFFGTSIEKYYKYSIIILLIIMTVLLLLLDIKNLRKTKKDSSYIVNNLIYDALLSFFTHDKYDFNANVQMSVDDFNKMNLFNTNYLKYSGNYFQTIQYENKKIVMSDVTLYDTVERIKTDSYYLSSTNTKYTINYHYNEYIDIFKGLYYETTINRENNEFIYMIPNNIKDMFIRKNIYHYIYYNGHKIELENLDFSERYSVFSLDEIKSRYILSITLMEKINKIDKLISNKKYFVFKSDGRVGIFIDGLQIEKIFNQKININKKISRDYLYKFFISLKNILDMALLLEDFKLYD
jgi:hypothetical protein